MTASPPIQRAGPAHALIMAAIHAEAFPAGERWDAAIIAGHLGMPGVFGLVHAAGGMLLGRMAADEAEILTLAVAPSSRRQGAGSRLVGAAMAIAREAGAGRMFLEVSARNPGGMALYAKAGFTEAGRRRAYYPDGSDALILSAPLERHGSERNCSER